MRIVALLLLLCGSLFGQVLSDTAIQNSPGNWAKVVPNARIYVCTSTATDSSCLGGGDPATIYTDATLSITLPSNQITADSNGNYTIFAIPGSYKQCVKASTSFCQLVGIPSTGSGGVNSSTQNCNTFYAANGTTVSGDCNVTDDAAGGLAVKSLAVNGTGAGAITVNTGLSPGAPASGKATWYVDSGTNLFTCILSGGGNCNPSAGSLAFGSITSGTNTAAAMVIDTGASLKPTNIGQNAGNQIWMQPALVASSVSFTSNTGGSLSTSGVVAQYTLISAAGESLPSVQFVTSGAGSCASSNCQATVVAPTIPSGYTGYTVYSCVGSTLGACSPLKQAASANCINITSNCVISTIGAGSGLPTTSTAYIQPPNIQAATLVPAGAIPTLFFPKADGNNYPLAGMDFSVGTPLPSPDGTFEFWQRLFVNDSVQNISGASQAGGGCIKNTLFSVCHKSGGVTSTGASVDDRAIAFRITDAASSPSYEQLLGLYGEAFTYNDNFSCNPTGFEDCFAGLRVRANDQRTAGSNNINIVGVSGTGSTNVASPKLGSCSPCVVGVRGYAVQETVSSQNANGASYAGVWGKASASASNTNGSGFGLWAGAPTVRFATQNGGLFIESGFSNAADFAIRSDATAKSYFKGALAVDSLNPLNNGTINTGGSLSPLAVGTRQLTTAAPSVAVIGTTGATTWRYAAVFKDVNGQPAASVLSNNITNGNATLDGTNKNRLTFWTSASSQVTNCPSTIDIYRTTAGGTPSTTGKIGTFTVTDCTAFYTSQTFDDTGLAGDSTSPPTTNNSGSITSQGPISTPSGPVSGNWNCVNVTPVTVNTSTTNDQNLMGCTIPANTLNSASKTLRIQGAAVYSTAALSTATINLKVKLCTVSGCGSGTVINLVNITSAALATITATNDPFNFEIWSTTQTAGASAAFEPHGNFNIDLNAASTGTLSVYADQNTATVGTIDSTAQLFLQVTGAFSAASGSNSITQRQLVVDTVN